LVEGSIPATSVNTSLRVDILNFYIQWCYAQQVELLLLERVAAEGVRLAENPKGTGPTMWYIVVYLFKQGPLSLCFIVIIILTMMTMAPCYQCR
jgi:hypothetical protein